MAETAQFEAVDRADGGELAPGFSTAAAKTVRLKKVLGIGEILGGFVSLPFGIALMADGIARLADKQGKGALQFFLEPKKMLDLFDWFAGKGVKSKS